MWFLQGYEKKPDKAIQALIDDVVKTAKAKWGLDFEGEYPTQGIGISSLRTFHVENTSSNLPNANDYNNWQIVISSANTWQDWINVNLDENIYVINSGMFNLTASPSITEVAFKANGIDLPVQNVEYLYTLEEPKMFWSKPYSVAPLNSFVARLYGSAAQTEDAGLIGFAIGRRLRLIQES